MRKFRYLAFAAILTVGGALGQTPGPAPAPTPAPSPTPSPIPVVEPIAIKGDTTVPCYGFARLDLIGTYSSAGWLCFPDRTTGAKLVSSYTANYTRPDKTAGSVFLLGGAPGTYDVGVFAVTPTGMQTIQIEVVVRPLDTPTPIPTPTPVPVPVPTPTPQPNPPAPNPTPRPFPSTQLFFRGGRVTFDV